MKKLLRKAARRIELAAHRSRRRPLDFLPSALILWLANMTFPLWLMVLKLSGSALIVIPGVVFFYLDTKGKRYHPSTYWLVGMLTGYIGSSMIYYG